MTLDILYKSKFFVPIFEERLEETIVPSLDMIEILLPLPTK